MANETRKILFLSSWYPTDELPHFGVFVREHARAILEAGVDIHVLASLVVRSKKLLDVNTSYFVDESGLPTTIVKIHTRFYDLVSHSVILQYQILKQPLKNLIVSWGKPNIVHSNVIFIAGMIGHLIASKLKIPHIITEHWSKIESILRFPFLSRRAKNAYQQADLILPVSQFLKHNISAHFPAIKEKQICVIGNVVPAALFQPEKDPVKHNNIRFCAIATWSHKKNPDKLPELFIKALGKVGSQTKSQIHLTMIGGGDRLPELKALCKEEAVNTHFTGYLTKKEIARELAAADFLVHASIIETFGVVVAEALMSGKPVIASRTGALPELINETNGVLCDNNLEDWVHGILFAINHDFNPKEISASVGTFTAEKIGKRISDVYERILNPR